MIATIQISGCDAQKKLLASCQQLLCKMNLDEGMAI